MPDELVPLTLQRLPDGARGAELAAPLREALGRGLTAIRERWPGAPAAGPLFAAMLASKLAAQPDLAHALPRLQVEDLFLAWWALREPHAGIAALWSTYARDLEVLLARFPGLEREELLQVLRVKLFVGSEGAPPRLASYSGFGFLQNWLRVLATRTFLDAARSQRRQRSTGLTDAGHDDEAPLLALIIEPEASVGALDRVRLHAAIRAAFARAVAALLPRQRTFLRLAAVDGLTLEQIAATYQVGRATVGRALTSGRAQLRAGTRQALVEELGISTAELDSVIRGLQTQLELSLARVLVASAAT